MLNAMDDGKWQRFMSVMQSLARRHDHEATGLEQFPNSGPVIVACNHSFLTYDMSLVGLRMIERTGRRPRVVVHPNLLKIPVIGGIGNALGFIRNDRDVMLEVLRQGEILYMAPGGVPEQTRGPAAKYRIDWAERRGFIWLSLLTGAPIVLAACPRADDLVDLHPTLWSKLIVRYLELPMIPFTGERGLPWPRKLALRHLVSEPIYPPALAPEQVDRASVADHHQRVIDRMDRLMADALALDGGPRAIDRQAARPDGGNAVAGVGAAPRAQAR